MRIAAVLAQLPGLNQPEVASLPAPSALSHYLLENPYPAATALAIGAAAMFFILNRGNQGRRGVRIGLALAAAAALVVVLANVVETARERLIANTRLLIDATAKARTGELSRMLADDCVLTLYGPSAGNPLPKEKILWMVEEYPGGMLHIAEYSIKQTQGVADSSRSGRAQVRVHVVVEGIPNNSWWRVAWRKDAAAEGDDLGGWRVRSIDCMQIDMVGDPAAEAR